MTDPLDSIFRHLSLRARVFHVGRVCSGEIFDENPGTGFVHLLRQGNLLLKTRGYDDAEVEAPALIFFGRPMRHEMIPVSAAGVELVCGSIAFGPDSDGPFVQGLPGLLVISLEALNGLSQTLSLMFHEAFHAQFGKQAALDRLCELFVIQLVRFLITGNRMDAGLLAGLSDPRLSKALTRFHQSPEGSWDLDELARAAGMSRSRFASRFRNLVGITPGKYMTAVRMQISQAQLRRGKALEQIAADVGYSSAPAFSRAFQSHCGVSPRAWLKSAAGSTG